MVFGFDGREPTAAGLEIAADVSLSTGSAVVQLPLRLPSGRDDFGPQLALAYRSCGANSPLGVGWALDGLLAVSIDPLDGVPRYDGTDGFSFAGETLVPEEANGQHGNMMRCRTRTMCLADKPPPPGVSTKGSRRQFRRHSS